MSMFPPKEWPIPIRGRGMELRNVFIMWRRSRVWSSQDAERGVRLVEEVGG